MNTAIKVGLVIISVLATISIISAIVYIMFFKGDKNLSLTTTAPTTAAPTTATTTTNNTTPVAPTPPEPKPSAQSPPEPTPAMPAPAPEPTPEAPTSSSESLYYSNLFPILVPSSTTTTFTDSTGLRYVRGTRRMCGLATGAPYGGSLQEKLENCRTTKVGNIGPCIGVAMYRNSPSAGSTSFQGCLSTILSANYGGVPADSEHWILESEANIP